MYALFTDSEQLKAGPIQTRVRRARQILCKIRNFAEKFRKETLKKIKYQKLNK